PTTAGTRRRGVGGRLPRTPPLPPRSPARRARRLAGRGGAHPRPGLGGQPTGRGAVAGIGRRRAERRARRPVVGGAAAGAVDRRRPRAADQGPAGLGRLLRRPDAGAGGHRPPGGSGGDHPSAAGGTADRRGARRGPAAMAALPRPVQRLAHRPVRGPGRRRDVRRHRRRRHREGETVKPGIHPEYGPVVYEDRSTGTRFLTRSTATSDVRVEWEDGNTYPLIAVDVTAY